MKITVMTPDENFITLDVDPDESVENVKALLEVETGAKLGQQLLHFNGREVGNLERLSTAGVREGDLITMSIAGTTSQAPNNQLGLHPDGSAVNPGDFQQHLRDNHEIMAQLFQTDPALAQAVLGENLDTLQNLLRERQNQRLELRRKQEEELALMIADPFDVESQRKIEEMIRQKGIDENMETAIEHNPEAFARVVMLYVDMEVNGVPIKAFVDSGAQSTIISKSCAERCGLFRLLDNRFRGVAVGVGQSEIIGRIHMAPIKIGNAFYPCSFTVLDAPNMEFLFGLDMLRKHQCMIDLKDNVLRVGAGEVSVPFLQEKDIPSHILGEERLSRQASFGQGSNPASPRRRGASSVPPTANPLSGTSNVPSQDASFEAKIAKLVELGFPREAAIQALKLCNGNEEQAAGFLFGG